MAEGEKGGKARTFRAAVREEFQTAFAREIVIWHNLKRGVRLTLLVAALLLGAWLLLRLVAGLHWWLVRQPSLRGTPPATMEIARDAYGVPTIYGETDAAVAWGLAYAHAEDDFPTIQERLAIVRGDLGRLQGADGARVDYVRHLLDAEGQVARARDRLSDEGWAMAEAYAAGINAYAAEHPDEVVLRRLFPVEADDIVEGFVLVSPFFFGLDRVLGDVAEGRNLDLSATFGDPALRGSNAFAVAPNRMADGSTVLISNSHQPWRGPVAWYEARVASGEGEGGGWSFSGVTFPGVPTILMGHNRHLGWTNTVNDPDLVDIYKLELDGDRYRFGQEWRELERRRVWLRVKWGPFTLPVPRMVERSVHGPVMRNASGAYAIRYASQGEVRHLDQYYRLMKTRSLSEWREVMAMQAIPATNFIYADHEGNIGMLYNASLPERDPAIDWSGVLPGERPELVWERYAPSEDIPFLLNPPAGFVFNANNAPFDATAPQDDLRPADFPGLVGIERRQTNRAIRAQGLLSADDELTLPELLAIREDTGVDPMSEYGASLREAFAYASPSARELLAQWNWSFAGDNAADALALRVAHEIWPSTYFDVEPPDPRSAMVRAESALLLYSSSLSPRLGELLRLREGEGRGKVDLPLTGGPGVLRAVHSRPDRDGRLRGWNGDGYILVVQWDQPGADPEAFSVMVHGSHPADPRHPHHADQAALFAAGRFKPAPLPRYEDRPSQTESAQP